MSRWPGLELQKKLFSILNADVTLSGMVTGVFDTPADEQPYPYITIGVGDISDSSNHTADGFKGFQQIDIWAQGMTNITVKQINERVYDLLNNIDLSILGFPTVDFRCTLSTIITESDNRT